VRVKNGLPTLIRSREGSMAHQWLIGTTP